jgi:uncharacterized membrane protein
MFEIDSLGGVFVGVFLLGVAVLLLFGTAGSTVIVGAVALAAVLLVVYYLLVRFDRWARGMSSSSGSSRQSDDGGGY